MSTLARSYLYDKLGPIVGPASRDGIVEYLLSCDASTQQDEMVSFLEQFGGQNPKFRAIVKQYALLEKNLGRVTGSSSVAAVDSRKQKNTNVRQGNKDKNSDKKVVLDTNCGCMATKHSIWGSCFACGRIYCTEEQVDACKYCGERVSPCMSAHDAATAGRDDKCVAAYRHKDKLLLFDSENTKRTQVHDTQSDYYHSSNWLSEEEKKEKDNKEKERYDQKFSRNSTFNISINVAGRRIVENADLPDSQSGSSAQNAPTSGLENRSLAASTSGRAGEIYRDLKARIAVVNKTSKAVPQSTCSQTSLDQMLATETLSCTTITEN